MKIGIMLRSLSDVGGPGEYTRNMLEALLRLDRTNDYYLFLRNGRNIERFSAYANVHPVVLETRLRFYFDQVLVPMAVRRIGCDVVINLKHSLPLLVGSRTVFVMHGADWIAFPQNSYLLDRLYHAVALPFFCWKADRIIAVSHNATQFAVARMRVKPEKFATIYHGFRPDFRRVVDPARLQQVRAKYKLPEQFVLFVGRIYPMKNVGRMIDAFSMLRDRIPHNLVIAGMKYFKADRDLAAIDRNNIGGRVNVIGFVDEDDLPAMYSMATAFLLPSLYEGFGIPLLEAMATGCPIVTSTAGSCPEVVGEAGVLVDPHNAADIARGILTVVTDKALAERMVATGYERVKQFSWDKCAQETLQVLQSVMTSH